MNDFIRFKKSNCKNCHKCIRYCPVKSIRFTGNQANVIADACILCGKCYVVCPQSAKEIVDETEIAKVLLSGTAPVYASVAPSFAAYFNGCGIGALRDALKKLGFADAEETAIGATLVKREYERLTREEKHDIIITTCCPSVNMLVEKYYPALVGYLAPVVTPMQAHCMDIVRRHPDAKTIFIGPCLSKKSEAQASAIDAALTFDEISNMFDAAKITVEKRPDSSEESLARLFPVSGGILKTLKYTNPEYTYLTIDGVESCKAVLDDIAAGNVHKCFIEMSACEGSCINGPIMERRHNSPLRHYKDVVSYAGHEDFSVAQPEREELAHIYAPVVLTDVQPSPSEITAILRQMGKYKPEDELNCGTCGYDTCREKAIAVYQGKAEITMCLPYLMAESERFSNTILDNTPNGILVVNDRFEVQQINKAAMRMMRVRSASDVKGEPLIRLMNPVDFITALSDGKRIVNKRDYYAEFDCYIELTIAHDKLSGDLIAIMRDVTVEEEAKLSRETMCRQTVETADKVVDRQMRIVQEIASLLGETAAETKIALTKLKESISDEN